MEKEYPCRTEVVNGITYRVKWLCDGIVRGATSFNSKNELDNYLSSMEKNLPEGYSFEVTDERWTSEVCIECGEERYK